MILKEYCNLLSSYCKKHIWWFVTLALVFAFAIICYLPYKLTQKGDLGIDFSNTGQIGDTIGGIMGPFVAIIAAFLTFVAFLVQYKANEIQKSELERQKEIRKREEFENKLFKMLEDYKDNAARVCAGTIKGKDAFPELLAELAYIYYCVFYTFNDFVKEKDFKYTEEKYQEAVWYYINQAYAELDKRQENIAIFAYSLFFYGKPYSSYKAAKEVGRSLFENEIYQRLKKIPFGYDNKHYSEYIYDEFPTGKFLKENSAHYQMMKGHNDQLGVYFRQLYQIVTFIANADEEIIDEDQKYKYAKLLRSQMTDSEQVMLFYNSLSEMGSAWNNRVEGEIKSVKDMGLLSRFLMIKNIPSNFPFFGISPTQVYLEEKKYWEYHLHKTFYEHETFTKMLLTKELEDSGILVTN